MTNAMMESNHDYSEDLIHDTRTANNYAKETVVRYTERLYPLVVKKRNIFYRESMYASQLSRSAAVICPRELPSVG